MQKIYIPYSIEKLDKMSLDEKILLAQIAFLSKKYGYCFANNLYLSKTLNKSPATIKRMLCKFEKRGVLQRTREDKTRKLSITDNLNILLQQDAQRIALLSHLGKHPVGNSVDNPVDKSAESQAHKPEKAHNEPAPFFMKGKVKSMKDIFNHSFF